MIEESDHTGTDLPLSKTLIGYVDCVVDGAICGWALLKSELTGEVEGSLTLHAMVSGSRIGTVKANIHRNDVRAAEGGDGLCGFAFIPPASMNDGRDHAITFTNIANDASLTNSPYVFRYEGPDIQTPYISCHIDMESNGTGFYDDEAFREDLVRNKRFGTFIIDLGELFPSFSYDRSIAQNIFERESDFCHDLASLFSMTNKTYNQGASSRIVLLSDVYVYNGRILHVSDGRVLNLYETARPPDRPYTPQPDWTPDSLDAAALRPIDPSPLLFLGSAGYHNYGHWLIDDLPRAAAVGLVRQHSNSHLVKAVTFGTNDSLNNIKIQSLSTMHPGLFCKDILFIPSDKPVYFPSLYYTTPVSYHPSLKSPEACRMLRDSVGKLDYPKNAERIFVSRRSQRGRTIENQAEIERALQPFGFITIDVELLTFVEQVQLFKGASVVVGCMGAAMTSSVFSKVGTWLIYLSPEGWIEPFYWDLATVCGHSYTALYGPCRDTALAPHLNNFTVDASLVCKVLIDGLARVTEPA